MTAELGCTERAILSAGDRDGELDFLGRIDQQVKLREFRIEPGEIEALLLADETVADTVVILREERGSRDSWPMWRARDRAAVNTHELRARLAARLPGYMVPAAFVVLPALPLTGNGKLDRQALPAPPTADSARRESYLPPRDQLESELVRLWEQILEVEPIGVEDDFFALGGSSLTAMRVVARLRNAHGVRVTVRSLFEQPTVASLARSLRVLLAR